jgi:integrase
MTEKPTKPNTARWTVEKYLNEIYIPDREQKIGLKPSAAKTYRTNISALNRYAGRAVRLREIDDEMLKDFKQWSLKSGCMEKTATDRIYAVATILRHWRPEEHPFKQRCPILPPWQNVDCEGSLEKLFYDRYLPSRVKITSKTTEAHYGRSCKLLGQFLGNTPTLADLTDHNIGSFLRWLVSERKVKPVTANGYVQRLIAIWNWAARVRLVEHFPTVEKLPEPEVVPQAWSMDQMFALIEACRRCRYKICDIPASDWWVAFHLLLWDSGERKGAVMALRWDMLNTKEGTLNVPAEIRKGGQKAMVYRLKRETIEALEVIRAPERELIFPLGKHDHTFYIYYKVLVTSAGLPYVPFKSGPQKIRRSFASYIKAAGGDATRALRHSTTRVTDESYLDPTIADPTSPNELLPSLVAPTPRAPEGWED